MSLVSKVFTLTLGTALMFGENAKAQWVSQEDFIEPPLPLKKPNFELVNDYTIQIDLPIGASNKLFKAVYKEYESQDKRRKCTADLTSGVLSIHILQKNGEIKFVGEDGYRTNNIVDSITMNDEVNNVTLIPPFYNQVLESQAYDKARSVYGLIRSKIEQKKIKEREAKQMPIRDLLDKMPYVNPTELEDSQSSAKQ